MTWNKPFGGVSMLINRFAILLSIFLISGCAIVKTPAGFLPRGKKAESNVYGSWMAAICQTPQDSINQVAIGAELIAIQNDSVYLLSPDTLCVVSIHSIEHATIVTHKYDVGIFALWTGLALTPNLIGMVATEYAGGFMMIGIPLAVTGLITSLIDAKNSYKIEYPGDVYSVREMNKFARFPQGIPVGLNPKNLLPKQIRWLPPALATGRIIYKDQTYKKKSPEYNSRSFYNTISFGRMFGKYEYGEYFENYDVAQKYGVGGIAFSNTRWHGDFQKGTFGIRLFAGNDKGIRQDNKTEISNQPVFGINPYYQYDWRYLGLGSGVVFGSLPWEGNIGKVDLQLDLRLGPYDIFFVEFKLNDHFPGSYPAPIAKLGIGTGLGLTNGTILRFGDSINAGTYLSASIPIKNNLIIEPFYGFADNILLQVDEGHERQFSLTLHYRFGQKANNKKR